MTEMQFLTQLWIDFWQLVGIVGLYILIRQQKQ